MPDAKFESGSVSISGDMTSHNVTFEEGSESLNSAIYPRKIALRTFD